MELKNKTVLVTGASSEIAHMTVAVIKNDAMAGEIVLVDGGISLKKV